jgi:hypothetical protein
MPETLGRAVRLNAMRSEMSISQLVAWLLGHVLEDGCDLSSVSDAPEPSDSKLDVRLPNEMISRLGLLCEPRRIPLSVCIRAILYAYYTRRLIFIEAGDRYTLVANHDQK